MELEHFADIIIKKLKSGKSVFLTGAAGTGKSRVAELVIDDLRSSSKNVLVTASTGTAAIEVGGITFHSAFMIGGCDTLDCLRLHDKDASFKILSKVGGRFKDAENAYLSELVKRLSKVDYIVIDEVSMLSKQHIQMLYYRLSSVGKNIPILFVGDFLQLPPVSNSGEFAFEHPSWRKLDTVVLRDVKRTDDKKFVKVLHKVREGDMDSKALTFLKKKENVEVKKDFVKLLATRKQVSVENQKQLDMLNTRLWVHKGEFFSDYSVSELEKKSFLDNIISPLILQLKVGAKVMVTVNQKDKRVVNGSVGTVVRLPSDKLGAILVDIDNVGAVYIYPHKFYKMIPSKNKDSVLEPRFYFLQYPLTLAYALTIHKSQGASIDKLSVDCNNIRDNTQLYVALSRSSNPKNLNIKNLDNLHIKQNLKPLIYQKSLES